MHTFATFVKVIMSGQMEKNYQGCIRQTLCTLSPCDNIQHQRIYICTYRKKKRKSHASLPHELIILMQQTRAADMASHTSADSVLNDDVHFRRCFDVFYDRLQDGNVKYSDWVDAIARDIVGKLGRNGSVLRALAVGSGSGKSPLGPGKSPSRPSSPLCPNLNKIPCCFVHIIDYGLLVCFWLGLGFLFLIENCRPMTMKPINRLCMTIILDELLTA